LNESNSGFGLSYPIIKSIFEQDIKEKTLVFDPVRSTLLFTNYSYWFDSLFTFFTFYIGRLSILMSKSISFVITTKNEEKYIKYTCLSIKNQDPTIRKKIILVDAESTDETVKIAKRFADIIIVKKSNIAQGKNIGASATNDELIAFINADVLLEKKWLKEMLEAFNDENVNCCMWINKTI